MRACLASTAAVLLLAPSLAGAEEPGPVRTSLFATGGLSAGSGLGAAGVESGALAGFEQLDDDGDLGGGRAAYSARGEIRGSRDGVEGGISGRAFAALGVDLGRPAEVPLFDVEVDGGLGVRPGLDARRDVGRGAYTHGRVRGHFTLGYFRSGDRRSGGLDGALGSRVVWQGGQHRIEHTMEMRGWYRCRLRGLDGVPSCADYFVLEAAGVTGGTEAVMATLYPVRLRGLGLPGDVYVDAAVGFFSNDGTMTIEQDGMIVEQITTEDLPSVSAWTWDVAVRRRWTDLTVEARTKRSGYITLDGDMSIEDRSSLTASGRRGRAALGAGGYAARTTWWTSKLDPSQTELTAGGDAWVTGPIAGVDAELRVAAGRTYYAALDGAVPAAPGLGVEATLTVRHDVKLR